MQDILEPNREFIDFLHFHFISIEGGDFQQGRLFTFDSEDGIG